MGEHYGRITIEQKLNSWMGRTSHKPQVASANVYSYGWLDCRVQRHIYFNSVLNK